MRLQESRVEGEREGGIPSALINVWSALTWPVGFAKPSPTKLATRYTITYLIAIPFNRRLPILRTIWERRHALGPLCEVVWRGREAPPHQHALLNTSLQRHDLQHGRGGVCTARQLVDLRLELLLTCSRDRCQVHSSAKKLCYSQWRCVASTAESSSGGSACCPPAAHL